MTCRFNSIVLSIVVSLFFISYSGFAQCDISTFTATPVNGVCVQDGSIQIAIPGAAGCSGANSVSATLREAGGTTDIDFITLAANGTGQFNNLPPGNYEVRLFQGANTAGPQTVAVSSSYTPVAITLNTENVSCASGDTNYSNDGQITVTFTGGNGPYTITLTGPGGPYVHNTPTPTTHTFTNLAPGNYLATIADNSATCASSESQSATIQQSVYNPPLGLYLVRRLVRNTCELYLRVGV